MPDTQYCYCCRVHHPQADMRLYRTRHGLRWRCLRSIEAAGRSEDERNHAGREQTRANHEANRRRAEFNTRLRAVLYEKLHCS